ncbi:MAG: hypothetical protein GWP06_02315 [Actinobacteria bacterium]|nr:hypothetical protein [Actinomycetota bacterium]
MKSAFIIILAGLILLLSILLVLALVMLLYRLILKIFAKSGTWGKLAKKYPAETVPTGILLGKKTIRIGAVRYRRCVTAGLLQDGLYLATNLSGHAPFCIPWGDFYFMGKTRIYSRQALQWSIGKPEIARIAFPGPLSEKLKAERIFQVKSH